MIPLISLSAVSSLSPMRVLDATRTLLCHTADTVVLTHALPATTFEMEEGIRQELLEKPVSKADHLRMLQDLNGNVCEVVTGVSLGAFASFPSLRWVLRGALLFDF